MRCTRSHGGAALSDDPLRDWKVAIQGRDDFVTDPDGALRKLDDLAMLARRRRQVSAEELNEMLEMSEAARLWALTELEEAGALGMFDGAGLADEGRQVIKGFG